MAAWMVAIAAVAVAAGPTGFPASVPIGVGVSLSPYVAACEKVLKEAGLKAVLHANGTNIEGEWDKVFAAVKRCHESPLLSTWEHESIETRRWMRRSRALRPS